MSASAERIINATAEYFGVRPCDLVGAGRNKTRVRMRFIAASLMRSRLDMSYPEIALQLGWCDHTSVINAVRRARHSRLTQERWATDFSGVERLLLDWHEERQIEALDLCA